MDISQILNSTQAYVTANAPWIVANAPLAVFFGMHTGTDNLSHTSQSGGFKCHLPGHAGHWLFFY
jgi:hypothetical protein